MTPTTKEQQQSAQPNKLQNAIHKKANGKAKFLANLNKCSHKGDVPEYMGSLGKRERGVT